MNDLIFLLCPLAVYKLTYLVLNFNPFFVKNERSKDYTLNYIIIEALVLSISLTNYSKSWNCLVKVNKRALCFYQFSIKLKCCQVCRGTRNVPLHCKCVYKIFQTNCKHCRGWAIKLSGWIRWKAVRNLINEQIH